MSHVSSTLVGGAESVKTASCDALLHFLVSDSSSRHHVAVHCGICYPAVRLDRRR